MAKLPNKFVPQRGSKRPYVNQDLSYRETMDRRPAKEDPDYQFRKQSEFKKPYQSPDYQNMEYRFDYPGINFDWPDINGGGDITPGLIDDINNGLWNANFFCSGSPCYCPEEERCFDLGCTWKIVAIHVLSGDISVIGTSNACITGGKDYDGTAQIQVVQKFGPSERTAGKTIYGSHVMSVSKCSDCVECSCSGSETIAYSDQEIPCDSSEELTITNQVASDSCYTWSLSGSDFAFDSVGGSQTTATGASVDLYAPETNADCDSSTIVTLSCDGDVVDSVKFIANCGGDDCEVAYVLKCNLTGTPSRTCIVPYNCSGAMLLGVCSIYGSSFFCLNDQGAGCASCYPNYECYTEEGHTTPGIHDQRTEDQLDAGCCPEELEI